MAGNVSKGSFTWDPAKEAINKRRHGLDFTEAAEAFFDPDRVVAADEAHSRNEPRLFCMGRVKGKIATVRFTYRSGKIRIIGAGYWRKGRNLYEETAKKKT